MVQQTHKSRTTRRFVLLAGLAALLPQPAVAQAKIKAVATISIIGDLVRNVGGDRVAVSTLVGPNGDPHVYAPTPGDARTLAAADIVFVNGLGLEGWMTRLVKASGSKAATVAVSDGVTPLTRDSASATIDPHAWQSVANARIYVANIRDGLRAIDPAGAATYDANAAAYLAKLDGLQAEIEAAIAKIPPERRKVVIAHDSFGYFGAAYGLSFIAPAGLAADTEPSAKAVAAIIALIKSQHIPAVFLENISDPRPIAQIARETDAAIGGTLYSDALSTPDGPAGSYIALMRHNVGEFAKALLGREGVVVSRRQAAIPQ
jgi:zinc/manganese transport system substrate-binding protein